MPQWSVDLHAEFVPEYEALPETVQDELLAHIAVLETFGPQLGRPRVDTLNGSRHKNMKELRGGSEQRFYRQLITKADKRFDAHIADLKTRETKKKGKQRS